MYSLVFNFKVAQVWNLQNPILVDMEYIIQNGIVIIKIDYYFFFPMHTASPSGTKHVTGLDAQVRLRTDK